MIDDTPKYIKVYYDQYDGWREDDGIEDSVTIKYVRADLYETILKDNQNFRKAYEDMLCKYEEAIKSQKK